MVYYYNEVLTRGTLWLKVNEIEAEYFPPKEDVILQNEAPTDLYIIVSGAVVSELLTHHA